MAEALSEELRDELQLEPWAALDVRALAAHLEVPVVALAELRPFGATPKAIRQLQGDGATEFSATTVLSGTSSIIVINDAHSLARQASSLAHELSHILLEHEPHRALDQGGWRIWLPALEEEASWLVGALLLPRAAALRIARRSIQSHVAANLYGTSKELVTWRLNQTGVKLQAEAERARRNRRFGPR